MASICIRQAAGNPGKAGEDWQHKSANDHLESPRTILSEQRRKPEDSEQRRAVHLPNGSVFQVLTILIGVSTTPGSQVAGIRRNVRYLPESQQVFSVQIPCFFQPEDSENSRHFAPCFNPFALAA